MNDYGCAECGSNTFLASDGTRVEEAVGDSDVLHVKRVTSNALDLADAAFLSMLWTCDNGHQVPFKSPLWSVLEILSAAPLDYGPVPLPRNERTTT